MKRLNEQEINDWYRKQPFFVGANFIPSSAINQLEMWQEETFEPGTIQRELEYAKKIGMNIMRVYLHDLLWEQDREGFIDRINQYLEIADTLGIKTMFVLFDDCWNQEFSLGKQPEPVPFTHNSGWVQSPGAKVVNDPVQWSRLEKYVTELLKYFKDDERIAIWDLYNEPGNGTSGDNLGGGTEQGDRSLPLLKSVFKWARQVDGLSQPITTGVWNFSDQFKELNEFALANSDIITFHDYNPPQQLIDRIKNLSQYERPMICTEYMSRGSGSTFEHCLPLLKKYNIGAINWGLVSGKSQTIYPWGWSKEKGEPDILFHDVFHSDGSFLYPREKLAIKRIDDSN
ncbi:MAG: cellulase family glycosylhydrolase [Lentisphaeria bacterium]|nr:cellulase family glycosylhydrolase [Lentisphaeria bacterium]